MWRYRDTLNIVWLYSGILAIVLAAFPKGYVALANTRILLNSNYEKANSSPVKSISSG
jgi:hypothetical protein